MEKLLENFSRLKIEVTIFAVVLIVGALFALYINGIGLTKILVDQNSHLNISRQITDSITPGINQVGLWPPLLHVLMSPASAIDPLFHSGISAAVVLVPLLGIASVMLYRLIQMLIPGRLAAIFGVTLFISNPYILYYSVTPMTELLFITTLIFVVYFVLSWLRSSRITHLIYAALSIVMASLARYEGFILVPIVALIVFFHLRGKKKSREEIEAILVLFGTIALLGVAYTFIYGWTFAGDPMAFRTGAWSAFEQQQDYLLPAQHSLVKSFQYLLAASSYMIGSLQVSLAALGSLAALIFAWKDTTLRATLISVLLIFASPFIFNILALYLGDTIIYVPELPPHESFFNERYGLYWFGFVVLAPLAFVASLTAMRDKKRPHGIKVYIGNLAASTLLVIITFANIGFLYNEAFVNNFSVMRSERGESKSLHDQRALAAVITSEYDGGKILITRALQNSVTVEAGIDLKNYIHESNYPYYEQTLERPWLFARWVVMYNPNAQLGSWLKNNELISSRWGSSDIFEQAYELVYENDSERLYRIREDVIYDAAVAQGVDTNAIPSLNPGVVRWDPSEIYTEIGIQYEVGITSAGVHGAQAREVDEANSVFFR